MSTIRLKKGNVLKQLRRKIPKLKQNELAERAGLNLAGYNRLENGKSHAQETTIDKLVETFNILFEERTIKDKSGNILHIDIDDLAEIALPRDIEVITPQISPPRRPGRPRKNTDQTPPSGSQTSF